MSLNIADPIFPNPKYSFARFHESPLTQSEAQRFCAHEQQFPSQLVEIDTVHENNAIVAEIKRRNPLAALLGTSLTIQFWLGITDRGSEGRWVTESNGNRLKFTNWSSGEPNNGWGNDEDCAHINHQYLWNDRNCNYKSEQEIRTALCEM